MLALKVNNKHAEKVRRYLKEHKLLDIKHRVISSNSFIYFPILAQDEAARALIRGRLRGTAVLVRKEFKAQDHKSDYRAALRKGLGKRYDDAVKGFDVLGDIAIIDAEPGTARKIAKAVMSTNSRIRTVLRKSGAVKGRYRTRSYAYVLGTRKYVADYKENGVVLRFDVRRSFFSSRLAFERKRVALLSRGAESVVVMFAGVGPFAVEIAKENNNAKVVAIELNKYAYRDMVENVRLNRLDNVLPVLGDVRVYARKYRSSADRIVMPLPKDSRSFLGEVVEMANSRCTVHYYTFVDVEGGTEKCIKELKEFFKEHDCSFRAISIRTVRPYSRDIIEIVIDFEIKKRQHTKNKSAHPH